MLIAGGNYDKAAATKRRNLPENGCSKAKRNERTGLRKASHVLWKIKSGLLHSGLFQQRNSGLKRLAPRMFSALKAPYRASNCPPQAIRRVTATVLILGAGSRQKTAILCKSITP